MLDFKIFLRLRKLLKNLKTTIFKKYLEINYFLQNKTKKKAILNKANMPKNITIWLKKNKKSKHKMKQLINTNPNMKVNLLHKTKNNTHQILDSKKIN